MNEHPTLHDALRIGPCWSSTHGHSMYTSCVDAVSTDPVDKCIYSVCTQRYVDDKPFILLTISPHHLLLLFRTLFACVCTAFSTGCVGHSSKDFAMRIRWSSDQPVCDLLYAATGMFNRSARYFDTSDVHLVIHCYHTSAIGKYALSHLQSAGRLLPSIV